MILNSKLNFSEHLKTIFQKTNQTMVLLFNHRTLLHRALLIPIYKSFIRPYLNNRDMMYDQTLNMLFQQERETIHDIAASAITCTIRVSSREKLYQELDLETLQKQHWHSKLCCFQKILKSQSLKYLYSIIPTHNMSYRTRQCNSMPAINVKHEFLKNTFLPSTIIEWNNQIGR